MMNPRTRRILVISLIAGLLIVLLLILWWFLLRPKPAAPVPAAPQPAAQALPEPARDTITQQKQQQEQAARVTSATVQSASKTFAERYGSYSNEANFANLTDVLPLMTAAYAAKTEAFIAQASTPTDYYGVSTRVITLTVDAMDEAAGTATVTVTTQREEAKGSAQNVSVRYQDLVLAFEMEGGAWKVSSATWK